MQFGELLFGWYMLGRSCHGRLDQLLNLMFNFSALGLQPFVFCVHP